MRGFGLDFRALFEQKSDIIFNVQSINSTGSSLGFSDGGEER